MKKVLLSTLLFFSLYAQNNTDNILESIQNDLQTYEEIATDTKQNVDYMPYVISVLNNKELVKLGVLTLREAIVLVPGVDISIGMVGAQNAIFRGSNPFAVGQSKLLIDGVVMNNQMFGAYNHYLDMPIDVIERIEVVRGPGSLDSSVNAFAGSINVISKANKKSTDKKENSLFAAFGSSEYKMGGYVGSYQGKNLELSSDLFYQEHDKTLPIGVDRFGTPATDAPLWLKNYSLGLNLEYKEFYIKSRFSHNEKGISYGQSFSTSEDSSDDLDVSNNSIETGYEFKIMKGVEAKLSLGYLDEYRTLQNKIKPDGLTHSGKTYPNGQYMLADHSAQTLNEKLEFKISAIDYNKITVGAKLIQSRVKNNDMKTSTDDMKTFKKLELLSNEKRDQHSFYVDDLVDFNEQTSLQVGLKFDHYSDVENQLSPRVAIVHRYNDKNIFKLMYTNSYREPSWREQYLNASTKPKSNLDLKPESVDAFEAAYVLKFNETNDFKVNLFYLQNKKQINAENNVSTFANIADNELYGLEAEIHTNISSKDKIYVNYSYVAGENTHNALTNVSQHMVKGYYIYNFDKSLVVSSILKYVGEKGRDNNDVRDNINAHFLADFTATYTHKPSDVLISLSVKNLFDEKHYLPSHNNTYVGDFEQEGRNFLVRLSKKF